MAANACSPVEFVCTHKNAFYFQVADTGVDEDAFRISDECGIYLIQSRDNKFLLLHCDEQFEKQDLSMEEQHQPDCKFNIQFYKNVSLVEKTGRAVMLYVNKDHKKMVACCNERKEIYPKAMDLPTLITGAADEAVFYRTQVPSLSNKYMFESSLYPDHFLGFQTDGDVPTLNKLVLLFKQGDEVVDFSEFSLSRQ